MKFLKNFLITFIILIVLTVIALWIFTQTISTEKVKTFVSGQISELTQKKTEMTDISWQILPRPGIRVSGLSIGG